MNELVDINNNLITREISNVLPDYEVNKVKNKLLDGTYHVQSIGTPLRIVNVDCNVAEVGKSMITEAYNVDKPIRLNWYGKYYIGLIHESPKWTIYVKGNNNKRNYAAQFTIVVSEEGSI